MHGSLPLPLKKSILVLYYTYLQAASMHSIIELKSDQNAYVLKSTGFVCKVPVCTMILVPISSIAVPPADQAATIAQPPAKPARLPRCRRTVGFHACVCAPGRLCRIGNEIVPDRTGQDIKTGRQNSMSCRRRRIGDVDIVLCRMDFFAGWSGGVE